MPAVPASSGLCSGGRACTPPVSTPGARLASGVRSPGSRRRSGAPRRQHLTPAIASSSPTPGRSPVSRPVSNGLKPSSRSKKNSPRSWGSSSPRATTSRDRRRNPNYHRPELLATAPNQVWSWDITKLLGPVKWTYFYLYVILDIFSRYVPGWMLAREENSTLAKRFIEDTCQKQEISAGELIIHSDRGTSMNSKPVAMLLADLGVTKSLSRPHVSNDNPYSEAQFKTLKYRPGFPDRFGSEQDGRAFCREFFPWYNTEHRHSGIGMMTPEAVHYGRAPEIVAARQKTLLAAYALHPERFVRRPPSPP